MKHFNEHPKRKGNQGFLILLGMCFLLLQPMSFASTTINADQNKRLSVSISYDSMNRIAFANDRIAQVFGDEEAYMMQTDDIRGQIFLKPTEANGEKAISITVTTENGMVQDLELLPKKISTATIILKGEKRDDRRTDVEKRGLASASPLLGFSTPLLHQTSPDAGRPSYGGSCDRVLVLIQVMKDVARQLVSQDPLKRAHLKGENEEELPLPLSLQGLTCERLRVIKRFGFSISVYRLTNTSDETRALVEAELKDKKGLDHGLDAPLAIATIERTLEPDGSTWMFVVRAL